MCDPVSAAVLQGSAVLMEGYGGYQAGKASKAMADQQAGILDSAADATEQRGLLAEEQVRRDVRGFMGRQRAAIGASGVVAGEGSTARLLDDTARQGELDALQVRNNAYLEAWGIRTNANTVRNEGRIAQAEGRNTLLTSALSASGYAAKGYGSWKAGQPPSGGVSGAASANYYADRSGYV